MNQQKRLNNKNIISLTIFFLSYLSLVFSNQVSDDLEIHEEKSTNNENPSTYYQKYDIMKNSVELKRSNKTQIEMFFVSSELFLRPEDNFKKSRNSFSVKSERLEHITVPEAYKNQPRKLDIARLMDTFNNSTETDVKLIEALHLDGASSVQKSLLIQKLKDFFNDAFRPNKLLFLSGACTDKLEFKYPSPNLSSDETLSYDEIVGIWRSRRQSDKKTELLLVVDCPFSGLWTEKCNKEFDYRDLSIQASATGSEDSLDLEGHGSLFVNNFIHAQKVWNISLINEILKPFEQVKKETDEKPIISNPYQEKLESEEKENKVLEPKTELEDSKLIHVYHQTPSSCGIPLKVAQDFKINALFNSWDEIVKNDGEYKEKNYTEINSIYKGEFKDGKPNGKGAIFYMKNQEKYLGEFVLSERQGRGIYYFNDTNVFEGIFRKDKKVRGVLHGVDGDWYTGDFKDEVFHGQGRFYDRAKNTFYTGEFSKGVKEGYGITRFAYGGEYKGMHKNNDFNGKGEFFVNGTLVSVSNYQDGEKHGFGWFLLKEGHNYTGNFERGQAKGQGKMKYKTGDVYTGNFERGRPNGLGKFKYVNGNIYEGEMKEGKRHGKGVMNVSNGDKYEGQFKEDLITGEGTLYYEKGIYKGDFVNGKFHGRGTLHLKTGGRFEGEFRDGKVYRNDDDL